MKFRRQERYSYHWTPAKEAAYLRKPQRVLNKLAERYPLIADQLTTPQSSLEAEKQRREELSNKSEMNMRNFRANQWRKARKLYFSCDQNTREIIKQAWQNGVYPADPTYLIYVIEKITATISAAVISMPNRTESGARKPQGFIMPVKTRLIYLRGLDNGNSKCKCAYRHRTQAKRR